MFDIVDTIKAGTLLVARKTFMYPLGGTALTKGKAYKVVQVDDKVNHITVRTDVGTEATFRYTAIMDYFSHVWVD